MMKVQGVDIPQDVIDLLQNGLLIQAIKKLRELFSLGLREAKQLSDAIELKLKIGGKIRYLERTEKEIKTRKAAARLLRELRVKRNTGAANDRPWRESAYCSGVDHAMRELRQFCRDNL